MSSVLLTAFEPFGGETINPSLEVARQITRLETSPAGADLTLLELPVDRHRAIEVVTPAILAAPDVVVMLGEAGGRFRVTPERLAINVDDYRIADNAGNKPADERISEVGPAAYFSTLPFRAIVNRLMERNIPAAVSNSAATYLCNRLFYSVMHLIATRSLKTRAGFIHLPYLHEQTVAKPQDYPSLSRETLAEAVQLAIEVSVESLSTRGSAAQG
jgi:pyroglutamyl-peptidase